MFASPIAVTKTTTPGHRTKPVPPRARAAHAVRRAIFRLETQSSREAVTYNVRAQPRLLPVSSPLHRRVAQQARRSRGLSPERPLEPRPRPARIPRLRRVAGV